MPKETSAGAVVFRNNGKIYYLLLHYKSGHWDFPKGHIENGEDEDKTVKREIEEETGIKDINIIDGFKDWINYFFRKTYEEHKKAPWVFKIVNFYLAETKTKQVKLSDEHIGYKWLNYDDALKQLTYKNAKEILKKANNYIIQKPA
jgi:8-oxo-dGTP pyrophosphatase MutT (NUDIX family)